MSLKSLAAAVALLALSAMPAEAVILTYTIEANYTAAVGAQLFFIDFNSQPVGSGNGNFAGQVDFGSPESSTPGDVFFNSGAMTDMGSTIAPNGVGPVDGIFASPVYAFGMDFSSGIPQTVELYDGSNTLLGAAAVNSTGFFGIVSDQAVSSFVIRNGVFASTGGNDRFFVDNFRANSPANNPVPEPASIFLLGTGLVGLGTAYRRRNR